ncbi:MAG TPA: cupin domain-containing protein [Thermoleophilia bacterium]|nr:cupin domain-containing protein [Thermoleophilia bacterium]
MMREPWVQVRLSELAEEHDESYGYYDLSKALDLNKLRANIFRFAPGEKMEYHSHTEQEEFFFVLEGQCTLVVDGRRVPLAQGSLIRLDPRPRRQIVNDSDADCLWLGVGAPGIDNEWVEHREE